MERDKALYVDANCEFSIRPAVPHKPGDNELLVEVQYSGINPADTKHATHLGILETVLGYDLCGRVVQAPRNSQNFSVGDAVAGYTPTSAGRPVRYGTHQAFICCPENMCFRVPEGVPPAHAAALTTVAMTGADVVFNLFSTPLPREQQAKPGTGTQPLLIWGASSSVGLCALQFAAASRLWSPILATASPSRHQLLRELGAAECFDYRSATAAADVRAAAGGPVMHAFDATGSGAEAVAECCPRAATLVSAVFQRDQRFTMPLATRHLPVHVRVGGQAREIPAKPEAHWRAWEALEWAVARYGREGGLRLPEVRVSRVGAEKALEEVLGVAEGRAGFGKVVIEHRLE